MTQKGGKVLGKGSFGCVISPPIPCKSKKGEMGRRTKKLLSKIIEKPSKTRFCPEASLEISILLEKFLAMVLSEISISSELPICDAVKPVMPSSGASAVLNSL